MMKKTNSVIKVKKLLALITMLFVCMIVNAQAADGSPKTLEEMRADFKYKWKNTFVGVECPLDSAFELDCEATKDSLSYQCGGVTYNCGDKMGDRSIAGYVPVTWIMRMEYNSNKKCILLHSENKDPSCIKINSY